MKKIFTILCVVLAGLALMGCIAETPTYTSTAQNTQAATAERAVNSVGIPQIDYFPERVTIANWYKYWNKPTVPTYVYIEDMGVILGYYVCNGKPASTQSFLTPETKFVEKYTHGQGHTQWVEEQQPDLDGTYGANNAGIRGFTASGIPFEWNGKYLYSGAPLPLNVPCLGK